MQDFNRSFNTMRIFVIGFIAVVSCLMLASIGVGIYGAVTNNKMGNVNHISLGINGLTETRCIGGYMFVISQDGRATQMLDSFGKGLACPKPNAGN